MKLTINENMSKITKKVINDFNILDDASFLRKYSCSKKTYYKRVLRYGDPYMKAPLAILYKILSGKSIFK